MYFFEVFRKLIYLDMESSNSFINKQACFEAAPLLHYVFK
jgi:hypothetical protein